MMRNAAGPGRSIVFLIAALIVAAGAVGVMMLWMGLAGMAHGDEPMWKPLGWAGPVALLVASWLAVLAARNGRRWRRWAACRYLGAVAAAAGGVWTIITCVFWS
jgi:hypothetical protein